MSAVSSHFAGTSSATFSLYGEQKNAIMQQLALPDGETVSGFARVGPEEPFQSLRILPKPLYAASLVSDNNRVCVFRCIVRFLGDYPKENCRACSCGLRSLCMKYVPMLRPRSANIPDLCPSRFVLWVTWRRCFRSCSQADGPFGTQR